MMSERVYMLRFWPKAGRQPLKTDAQAIAQAKAENYLQVSETYWKKTIYIWERERIAALPEHERNKSRKPRK